MRDLLAGLVVTDFSQGYAGGLATMILADAGATVTKVEPPGGDWARSSPGHRMWGRGKRSVVLDLELRGAREQARQLACASDVVVQAWRPGVARRLGLDYDDLAGDSPQLVHCSITGFGPAAELAEAQGYEGIVSAACGLWLGLDELSGAAEAHQGDRPVFKVVPVNSYAAAQLAVQGIAAALIAREATGRGRSVSTSLLQGAASVVMRQGFVRDDGGGVRSGPSLALVYRGIALCFLTVACADGKWIQMCARQDHHFRNWLRLLGLEAVLDEPRFARAPLGLETLDDADELEALLRAAMATRSRDDWMRAFMDDDVGADPFLEPAEFLDHPQLHANGRVISVEDPEVGPTVQLAPLFGTDGGPPPRGAPRAGEHDGQPPPVRRPPGTGPRRSIRRPLEGKTILELAYFLAGPLGATQLAELGARVIKVEPPSGEPFRRSGVEWAHLGHGKESVVVDLKTERGRAIVHALIARSDALLQSFRPGVAERLGVDYATASAINPRLVYVFASSFGSHGPHARRAAFHSTPTALSGGGVLQAGRGNPPVDDSWPDPVSGSAVGTALALGLWWQQQTGRGRYLETNMLASSGYAISEHLVRYPDAPQPPVPDGAQQGLTAGYRLYRCRSGWLFLGIRCEPEWRALWASDVRFAAAGGRGEALEAVFAEATAGEWEARLTAFDVPCAQADAVDFPGFLLRHGLLTPVEHPAFGPYYKLMPKLEFSDLVTEVGDAPALGQHTQAVLAELGY